MKVWIDRAFKWEGICINEKSKQKYTGKKKILGTDEYDIAMIRDFLCVPFWDI